ncbi:MAG TPA: PQQ-dependent sugar dehydrogenase [Symbiobacteriaceae bacterium]|nr:PQQ-dependent sugar dehydrogenase [Symbiobacteriaceae bacterium]
MRVVQLGWLLVLAALAVGAPARAGAAPAAPPGFQIEAAVSGLHHPTRLVFGPDGRLYVAQQTGEVIAITLVDGREAGRAQVAKVGHDLLGIALAGDRLWISETGKVALLRRQADGTYGERVEFLPDIPHGRHQNDGLVFGPDGLLYLGVGSTTDRGPERHPWSGTIVRFDPDDPSSVTVYARGFRNPYGLAWDEAGVLWATDNGADDPVTSDELNRVLPDHDYGYPTVYENPPPGSTTTGPTALFGKHNSTNGLAYYGAGPFPEPYRHGFFAAMWGSSFDETTGRGVAFVAGGERIMPFVTGLQRPLDLTVGPDGDLWVGDFTAGTVYRIWYAGGPTAPPPVAEETVSGPWGWIFGLVLLAAALAGLVAGKLRRGTR